MFTEIAYKIRSHALLFILIPLVGAGFVASFYTGMRYALLENFASRSSLTEEQIKEFGTEELPKSVVDEKTTDTMEMCLETARNQMTLGECLNDLLSNRLRVLDALYERARPLAELSYSPAEEMYEKFSQMPWSRELSQSPEYKEARLNYAIDTTRFERILGMRLLEAQEAGTRYRNEICDALSTKEGDGSDGPIVRALCRLKLVEREIKDVESAF